MSGDLSLALAPGLVGICAATAVAGWIAGRRPGSRGPARLVDALGLLALAVALVGWGARCRFAGHLPLFGTYESAWSLTLAVLVAAVVARWRSPARQGAWVAAGLIAAGVLAHGLAFRPDAFPLTISERSWVVDVHAIAAWAAFGCLAVNASLAVHRLLAGRAEPRNRADPALAFSLSLGFVLHSAMMASGSIYKFMLFGTAWSFDPIETLGFAAWVSYGTLLHLHLFAGWNGRRLAAWCLGLFVLLVVSYRGIVYFPSWSTYHIFDMDLRLHIPQ
jgi:hypothetical protein